MSEALVLVARDEATCVLTLNRPAKKNALNDALLHEFAAAVGEAARDETVRTIVVTGAGECFSSGRDTKDVGADTGATVKLEDRSLDRTVDVFTEALRLLIESPKPTVAAVRGYALGGGQAMTLACDFVVAERGARFGNVEIAYGFPAAMNAVLLGRHIGRRLALEIALTGEVYDAQRYQALGLVNRLAEPGELQRETRTFVEVLNARAPWAVRRTKELMRSAEDAPLASGLFLGGQLNQLLRLNSVASPPYQDSDATRTGLKGKVGRGE